MRSTSLRRALFAAPLALLACATQVNEPVRTKDGAVDRAEPDVNVEPDVAEEPTQPPPDVAPPEDLPSPLDTPPTDVGGCATGLAECGGSCRDTATDPMHCGGCGQVCARGQVCAAGACACPTGQLLCGAACVSPGSDPAHCGMCGRACPMGQACSSGACMVSCASGTSLCNGSCRDLMNDRDHCGVCGRPCPAGHTCAAGVCRVGTPGGPEFRLNWLGSTNCRSAEHAGVTGADRGGIALTNAQLFYTGQTTTGRFNLATLDGTPVGTRYDALVSNLRTAVVYSFVDAMGMPITAPTGVAVALRELDSTTGALTTRQVMLSAPIPISGAATGSSVGFFSGWDRVLVLTSGRAYNINLPSGAVLDLGTSELPARSTCAGWAFWGVAEFSSGIPSIVYVSDPTTLSRRPLPMGPVTPVSSFMSLSNMCAFTVAPAAQRWYFHHARNSQLGGGAGAMETVGYCDASTSIAGPTCPTGVVSCGGVCRNLMTDANHCGACNTACGAGNMCSAGRCTGSPRRYTRTTPPLSVAYVDACLAPGHVTALTTTDDSTTTAMMPFDFRYWGDAVPMGATLTVSSNGFLIVGTGSDLTTGRIPSTFVPNSVIAPQWVDLFTRADGVCLATAGTAPDRRFVVQWSNVRNYAGPTTNILNFEATLNERDASIDLLYATMTGAATATVGIENRAGTEAIGGCPAGPTATSCVIPANTRVRFEPSM